MEAPQKWTVYHGTSIYNQGYPHDLGNPHDLELFFFLIPRFMELLPLVGDITEECRANS